MRARSNSARVRQALENEIIQGRYAPGQKLDPEELAHDHNCSRTPIREALQQLESSGLVRVVPKRGTFVSKWSVAELAERFEAMAEMEAVCARLAAARAQPSELTRIEALHETCRRRAEEGDVDGYYFANSDFHGAIYRASHNGFLAGEAARLHAVLQPYRRMQLRVRGRVSRSFDEHDEIVSAIRAGDGERAAVVIRDHVRIQGERFHDLVAALSEATPA
ncbi:GntR family transcriptional regulator [Aureimonas mangrovi]|uniref:GntR family transcriptional regulator n=1 Tax=Aureimonas mangrovi TaxID=2758041 RepID=UPI00163DDF54|nr:GntR family transcriptional regulator [Aureimonas mangrovi]